MGILHSAPRLCPAALEIKADEGCTFHGTLSDATAMTVTFVTTQGRHAIPFSVMRTGDARIAPAPRSAPIGKELEGTWHGHQHDSQRR